MTPEYLKQYLEVIKGSGLALVKVEIPGELLVHSVGTVNDQVTASADTEADQGISPDVRDLLNRLPVPART